MAGGDNVTRILGIMMNRYTGQMITDPKTGKAASIHADTRAVCVYREYHPEEITNLYLYSKTAVINPAITSTASIGDYTLTVDTNASLVNGMAITIYEGSSIYQSLIRSTAETTITMASPVPYAYTAAATVDCAVWKANVDGSETEQVFTIKPPPNKAIDVHSIRFTITDGTTMDSAKFGGITELTNGLLAAISTDGVLTPVAILVNNIGFAEQGFTLEYDPKAPAGVYGIRASLNVFTTAGTIIRLDGTKNQELQVIVRDDLTDLTLVDINIGGHIMDA